MTIHIVPNLERGKQIIRARYGLKKWTLKQVNNWKTADVERGTRPSPTRHVGVMPLEPLSKPGSPPFPVVALIVAEHKVVAVQVMDDAVDAAVAFDVLHLGVATHGLALSMRLVEAMRLAAQFLNGRLSLEQSDAETAGLENINDLLNDVVGSLAVLRMRNVGLEGRIRAVRFWGDVHGEIVRRSLAIRSRGRRRWQRSHRA